MQLFLTEQNNSLGDNFSRPNSTIYSDRIITLSAAGEIERGVDSDTWTCQTAQNHGLPGWANGTCSSSPFRMFRSHEENVASRWDGDVIRC
jgi:hypothetical protein